MTTLAKLEANRTNGKLSNGPTTPNGKAVAKMNAVTHGLRSLSPVLPDERPKDWNDHRKGIVAALAPVGTLEAELAERVALLTWRLRRVVRYETAVTSAGIDHAVARVRGEKDEYNPFDSILSSHLPTPRTYATVRKELEAARGLADGFAETRDQLRQLPNLPADHPIAGDDAFSMLREIGAYTPNGHEEYTDIEDHEFLAAVGVPAEWLEDADWWDGWTAGAIRAGVKVIAEDNGMTETELIECAVREADRTAGVEQRKATRLEALLDYKAEEIADAERVARGRALLPSVEVVDKVMRYESHLNKQLTQTLHQLERLQAIRSGNPPTPPAALDVTVEAGH
ncbi:MAG: hypothetical protein L0241_29425 [Planctomycetia bacterium]|nr:hypothetical protein [Planctomycetia bacterium]